MSRRAGHKGAPVIWRLGQGRAPAGAHVAVVPGAQAPLLPLDLPDKLRGMARERVATRQMVEHLGMPAARFEMRPFVVKGDKTWRRVMVADAGLAAAWRKGLGAGCSAVLPDYLALPTAPNLWTIEVAEGRAAVRLGPGDGFTAEPELALAMLAEAPVPGAVLRLGDADPALDGFLAGLGVPVHKDIAGLRKAGFTVMRWSDATGGLDLKDPPSAVYDRLRSRIMRWRVPALATALAVAAWLGTLALETHRYQAEATLDRNRMIDLVREHFVPTGPVLDVRVQVSAALERARGPVEAKPDVLPPLTQFQIAAEVLTRDDLRVLGASYRQDTGLVATIEAKDFATLDSVVEALAGAGFAVQQLDSRAQQPGGVVARLRLDLTS